MQVFGKKIDRLLIVSIVLHLLVIGGMMVSVSSRPAVLPPEDVVPVDIVTASQMTQIMQGVKNGKKENPKPLVDKIAEAKPVKDDEAVGKIEDKKPPIKTTVAPEPPPKPEKPVEEKKPEPPKPVVKNEPKPEPPKPEKKPEPKKDELGDLMKDAAKQPPPKPQPPKQEVAKAAPPPKPKQERNLDDLLKTALVDKRDPTRQSIAGSQINSNAAVGTAKGSAAVNSGTWIAMFTQQVKRCWRTPFGGVDSNKAMASLVISLKPDGSLQADPVPERGTSTAANRIFEESAIRAVIQCAPYNNLPAAQYNDWKSFFGEFTPENLS